MGRRRKRRKNKRVRATARQANVEKRERQEWTSVAERARGREGGDNARGRNARFSLFVTSWLRRVRLRPWVQWDGWPAEGDDYWI